MCNAWNHPTGCTCGWGGEGHFGRKRHPDDAHAVSSYWWVPPITQTRESYVNPNAFCPKCDASVFFYQSPNGGRVFFDELGPPWPKHPCTDNASIPKFIKGFSNLPKQKEGATNYKWQIDRWSPFFISVVVGIDKSSLRINGTNEEHDVVLYTRKVVYPHSPLINPISRENIAFLKKTGDGCFKLSLLTIFGTTIIIDGFSSLTSARSGGVITIPISKDKSPDRPHGIRSNNNMPSTKGKHKRSSKKKTTQMIPDETTMAHAFAAAKKKRDD